MPFLADVEHLMAVPSTPENLVGKLQAKDLLPKLREALYLDG